MPRVGLRLSRVQEAELKDRYQSAKARKDLDMCLRTQGLLLVNRGNTEIVVADLIGVGRRTLQVWIRHYRQHGISGLVKGPYLGGRSRLTQDQKAELSGIIAAGPEKAGFDTGVWIASMVVKLVRDLYGVSYSSSQIGRILHELRFPLQYPTRKPSKADEKAEEQWRTEDLPAIKKSETRERASAVPR
jgi:transposase